MTENAKDSETDYKARQAAARAEGAAATKALCAVCEEFLQSWQAGADRDVMTVLRGRLAAAKRRVKQSEQEMMLVLSERCTPEELEVLDGLACEAVGEVLAALAGGEGGQTLWNERSKERFC